MEKRVVYDIEVLKGPNELASGWSDPHAMGFGTAVVYDYAMDQYLFYQQKEKSRLIEHLIGKKVIGFNSVRFDNNVLLKSSDEIGWTNIDLLLEVVRAKFGVDSVSAAEEKVGPAEVHDGSIGLDGLACGTLGKHKTGHGSKAPLLIRDGRWSHVFAYNLHDVRLTRQLYDFAQSYGYLIDRMGNRLILSPERLAR